MSAHTARWVRPTKMIGISLFLGALLFFVALLSMSEYTLTETIVQSKLSGEKQTHFQAAAEPMLAKTYSSKFDFLDELSTAFDKANEGINAVYGVAEEKMAILADKIYAEHNGAFTKDALRGVFSENDEAYQLKQIQDYTSWMEGRSFANKPELQQQLANTAAAINKSIAYKKGFDKNAIRNLRFELTKDASSGAVRRNQAAFLWLSVVLCVLGGLLYIIPQKYEAPAGIKHNKIFTSSATSRGLVGIVLGTALIAFYVFLYEFPEYITGWVILVDPISYAMNGGAASRWFLYGLLYTLAILVMGVRMIVKYHHNMYQIVRTISVMFFQTAVAFILVQILKKLNLPAADLKNIWPLDYSFFFDYRLNELAANGTLGYFMLGWGIMLFLVGVPVLTYFFGKRWYCSWVCGCGGLAETLGDPFRQLSDKSTKAWQVERWMVHSVLVFAVFMTAGVIYTYFTESYTFLGMDTYAVRGNYGFVIGSVFSGIVGTGFYPLMGNRVWCRFGCPLAAYLGIVQRFKSRFRITTNGGQCISCGNCSTYCEMGIDVRAYAQRGQDIVRASCVGCGVCSAVCPRGVLKLENGTVALDEAAL